MGQLNIYTEQPWSLFGLGTRRSSSVPAAVLGHLQHLFHRCFCPFPGARSSYPLALLLFLPSGLAPLLPQYDPISSSILFCILGTRWENTKIPKETPWLPGGKSSSIPSQALQSWEKQVEGKSWSAILPCAGTYRAAVLWSSQNPASLSCPCANGVLFVFHMCLMQSRALPQTYCGIPQCYGTAEMILTFFKNTNKMHFLPNPTYRDERILFA